MTCPPGAIPPDGNSRSVGVRWARVLGMVKGVAEEVDE